jgi:hypothetical protein
MARGLRHRLDWNVFPPPIPGYLWDQWKTRLDVTRRVSTWLMIVRLFKRIHDLQTIDLASRLHIFREEYAAAGLFSCPNHKSIPE